MFYLIGIISTIAWIWLIVIAFKSGFTIWGIAMILFFPACFIFGLLHWNKASVPFILLIVSIGLMFTLSPEQISQMQQN
ncbi:MAG: hypothetical protein ACI85N_000353 [Gammaproteobacteria bacterium]|jgi:hypothetical protein